MHPQSVQNNNFPAILLGALKRSVSVWLSRDGPRFAAALSFYLVFSLAPLILLVLISTGLFLDYNVTASVLYGWSEAVIGSHLTALVAEGVSRIETFSFTTLPQLITSVFLITAVSFTVRELMSGIATMGDVPAHRAAGGVLSYIWHTGSLIIVLAILLVFSIIATSAVSELNALLADAYIFSQEVLAAIRSVVTTILFTFVFVGLFRFFPSGAYVSWPAAFVGGVTAAILITIAKTGVGIYLEATPTTSLYEAASSIFALLIWIYVSTSILYFGVVVSSVYGTMRQGDVVEDDMQNTQKSDSEGLY